MRKVIPVSVVALLALVVLGGLAVAYVFLGRPDRGIGSDGRLAPPASVRGTAEAPKYEAAKSHAPVAEEKRPEYQLPTEFKLPADLEIATPPVPEGLGDPAPVNGQKT